jgi:hypothetical protein
MSKRAQQTAQYPLRVVLGYDLREFAVLECRHHIAPARDKGGVRYPARRRCWKCHKGLPPDIKRPGEADRTSA